MVRCLVLGATGHIGAHVVRALLGEGHHVRAAYRTERFLSVIDQLPIERIRVDLDSGEGLKKALEGCDWVFHAAGYYPNTQASCPRAIEEGVLTARRALEAFRKAGAKRIVFTSSASTIARVPSRLATESDSEPYPLRGWRPLYAAVKIAMEHEAAEAARGGLPVVIVNPSVCLGEYDAHLFSGRLILAFAKHRLPFTIDKTVSVIYTGDVAVGHLRAAERGRVGERYLLTNSMITIKDFAGIVCRLAEVPPPRWRLPIPVARAAAEISEAAAWLSRTEPLLPREAIRNARIGQALDGSKAIRELKLELTPIEEAIRRALAWFRKARTL